MNSFVIVTCNRPDRLTKCLESIINNTTGSIEVFICDDSKASSVRDENRQVVDTFKDSRLDVRYYGLEEKKSLLNDIKSKTQIDSSVFDFLFFDPYEQGMSAGANRNFALLLTKGKKYISLDDDIIFEPQTLKNSDSNFSFEPFVGMGEIIPIQSLSKTEEFFNPDKRDLLNVISSYLGKNLNDILKAEPTKSQAINKVDARWAMSVLMSVRKIKLCSFSIFGHSGFSSNDFIFFHPPKDQSLLPENKDLFDKALASHLIIRGFPSITFANISMAPAGAVAIDNTEFVPPFFSVLRGEDIAWTSVLRYLQPPAVFCYLNTYLKHEADETSSSMQHQQRSSMELQPFYHLIAQVINQAALNHKKRGYAELAQVLEGISESQVPNILELCSKKIKELRAKTLRDLKLQENMSLPNYWKQETKRLIHEHEVALKEDRAFIPNDLNLNSKSLEFQTAQLISAYGKALRVWPKIIKAI